MKNNAFFVAMQAFLALEKVSLERLELIGPRKRCLRAALGHFPKCGVVLSVPKLIQHASLEVSMATSV